MPMSMLSPNCSRHATPYHRGRVSCVPPLQGRCALDRTTQDSTASSFVDRYYNNATTPWDMNMKMPGWLRYLVLHPKPEILQRMLWSAVLTLLTQEEEVLLTYYY